MANKQRSQIYEDVVQLLKKGSYTTLQVAEKTGINWETAKNAVETLSRINLITSHEENGKNYYTVNEANFLQLRKDTLLGLPLDEKQEKATKALLSRIKEIWFESTGKSISKTFQQKILVRLVEDNNIPDIPYGWYLFGECAVLFNLEDSDIKPTTKYDKEITKIVTEYKLFADTKELLNYDYTRKGNELYLKRLRISGILLDPFNVDSLVSLKKNVRDFLFTFSKTENNKEIVELLNAFASMIFRLVNHKNEKELEDLRSLLNETFSSLWESMATYNLLLSLQNKGWYDEATLQRYYKLRKEILQPTVESYLTILNDHVPNLVPENEPLRKFKGPQAK